MSEDINVTDGTILEALNNKVDLDGGNYLGSGLEEIISRTAFHHAVVDALPETVDENVFYFIKE